MENNNTTPNQETGDWRVIESNKGTWNSGTAGNQNIPRTSEPIWDLIKEYADKPWVLENIEHFAKELHGKHPRFEKGQRIQFLGGYENNTLMESTITGFDNDGDIYVVWDCYWFPIRDEVRRQIKIVETPETENEKPQFKCFEIHRANMPDNGCTAQCPDCLKREQEKTTK